MSKGQSMKSNEREWTQEKMYLKLTFYVYYVSNCVLKISMKFNFCLCIVNIDSQTNKLQCEYTLNSEMYTLQSASYIPELSRPKTSQGRGPMKKSILWPRRRLVLRFILDEIAWMFDKYVNVNLYHWRLGRSQWKHNTLKN